jgi:hypothetical protein
MSRERDMYRERYLLDYAGLVPFLCLFNGILEGRHAG